MSVQGRTEPPALAPLPHPLPPPSPLALNSHGLQQLHVLLVSSAPFHLVVQLEDDFVFKLRESEVNIDTHQHHWKGQRSESSVHECSQNVRAHPPSPGLSAGKQERKMEQGAPVPVRRPQRAEGQGEGARGLWRRHGHGSGEGKAGERTENGRRLTAGSLGLVLKVHTDICRTVGRERAFAACAQAQRDAAERCAFREWRAAPRSCYVCLPRIPSSRLGGSHRPYSQSAGLRGADPTP